MSESDVSRLTTPTASYDSFTHHPPPLSAHQLPESHSHSPTTAAQQQHQVLNQNREQYENGSDYDFMAESSNGVVELDERGLPKVVHPLTSLITPFSNAVVNEEIMIEESYHGGQPPDKRNKSPLKLHINVPGGWNKWCVFIGCQRQMQAVSSCVFIRGSFKRFYLLFQNFINIKASHMKFVTFVTLSLSYTFVVNPRQQKRENGTKINVLILLVPLIHYDKWTDVFTSFKTKISHISLNTTIICL